MNKAFTRTLFALCTSLLLTAFIFSGSLKQTRIVKAKPINERGGGLLEAEDDYDEYYQWDLKRFANPATGAIPTGIRKAELAYAAQLPQAKLLRGPDFVNRGPYNVGGRTRAFAIDVNDTNIYIAASVSGSIYRSTNAGLTWTRVLSTIFDEGFSCLVQDTRPGYTNTWYAGSGEGISQSASGFGTDGYFLGNGIYKSTDDGITWDTLTTTAPNTPQELAGPFQVVWSIKTDPSRLDSSIVYASTYGGIYRSNNAGLNWKLVKGSFNGDDSYYTNVDVTASGVVYATLSSGAPDAGIWRSTNGLDYTNITPDSFAVKYSLVVDGITPSNENVVYFLANTINSGTPDTNFLGAVTWDELWKYTYINDSTSTWENLSANLPYTHDGPFDKYDPQSSYNMVVAVKPDDPNTVIIGGTNVYRSTDGFETNANISQVGGYQVGTHLPVVLEYGNSHPDQHVFFFDRNNPSIFYNGSDGGVRKTMNIMADSVAWVSLNNGYLTTQFYAIAIDNASPGDSTIIGGTQDNGSWFINNVNPQANWVTPDGGDGAFCAIADHKSAYYFSIESGKTERAILDGSGNVTSFTRIDPQDGRNFQFVNPFILDPTDENIMYMAADHKVWRNDSLAGIPMVGGYDSITTNWMFFPDTLTTSEGNVTALACSVDSAHVLYYGTDTKYVFKIKIANTGTPTPQNITPAAFPAGFVNCIAIDPQDNNKVVVVFSNYSIYSIWYTTDGGTTWSKAGGNLEENSAGTGNGPSCRWVSIMHVNNGTLYFCATSTGLYATDTLNGLNTVWELQGAASIGNDVCDMVVTRPSDGLVVVATHGNGIFTANYTEVQEAVGINELRMENGQWSIYPNPGSDDALLSAYIINNGPYVITIYDAEGRMVSSTSTQLAAGQNTIPLHFPQQESSGIYFVNIASGSDSRTLRYLKL